MTDNDITDVHAPLLTTLRFGALLNTASGSCDVRAEHELEAICRNHGVELTKVWCGGGAEVAAALKEVDAHKLDVLIVLGGDGTIRSAAATCTARGPFLVPLPGGTMNMLPKALYGDCAWQEALSATLASPAIQQVSGGKIGKETFFVAAILGNPSLWAKAREAVREGDFGAAVGRSQEALAKSFTGGLRYDVAGVKAEAEAISVLCPLTSAAMDDNAPALEVAVFTPQGAFGALKLALTSLVADWRSDASVEVKTTQHVAVASDDPIPAILDGESLQLDLTATVDFVPVAFQALRPQPAAPAVARATE